MAFKDILVALTSYPEPSPSSVVDDAVSIAAVLGAHLAALSCETHVQMPGHFLSGSFANIPGIIAGEGAKSRQNAQDLLATFDKAAEKAPVFLTRQSFKNARQLNSRTCSLTMRGSAI